MQHIENNIAGRIQLCANKVGGKRKLANLSGISESQLFRYLRGEISPRLDIIAQISRASDSSLNWLVSGDEIRINRNSIAKNQTINGNMPAQILAIERALLEFNGQFSLPQKAIATPLLLLTQQKINQVLGIVSSEEMHRYLVEAMYFLQGVGQTSSLQSFWDTFLYLEDNSYNAEGIDVPSFVKSVERGCGHYYNSVCGEFYFERTQELGAITKAIFTASLNAVLAHFNNNQITMLDVGCGNGRYIQYAEAYSPQFKGFGVDSSDLAIKLCHDKIRAGKIADGRITKADIYNLPSANNSFDFVMCNNMLQFIPYIKNSNLGVEQAISELARVTKPNGIIHLVLSHGHGQIPALFQQMYNVADIEVLAQKTGLKLMDAYSTDKPQLTIKNDNIYTPKKQSKMLSCLLIKN